MAEALEVHVSTWIYSVIYLIYSDIPEFILQQTFNELIDRKLGLSQKIKTKQFFIVFDWKEGISVAGEEEEGKVIATRFIIIYDFAEKKKSFLSSFFMLCLFSVHPPNRLYYLELLAKDSASYLAKTSYLGILYQN